MEGDGSIGLPGYGSLRAEPCSPPHFPGGIEGLDK